MSIVNVGENKHHLRKAIFFIPMMLDSENRLVPKLPGKYGAAKFLDIPNSKFQPLRKDKIYRGEQ